MQVIQKTLTTSWFFITCLLIFHEQILSFLCQISILCLNQFEPPCGISKNVFSKERLKLWFFVAFNIIISRIFPENFIEIPQVVQKI